MRKTLIILTAIASLTIATAYAGTPYSDWVIKKAHQHGYSDKQMAFCAAAHMVWDSSDNSFVDGHLNAQQRSAFAAITDGKTNPNAWTYLVPDFNVFGFRDSSGVLHAWRADQARYNHATRDYQVLIRGHWLSVGRDVYQLTDSNRRIDDTN
jgi:hypothetical protein